MRVASKAMRILMSLALLAACSASTAKAPAPEFDERVENSIRFYFEDYVTRARGELRSHELSCEIMRSRHEDVQAGFEFIIYQLDGYHSRLRARLDATATTLDALRNDIWADRGCLPSDDH